MTGIYRKVVWYLRGRKEYTRYGAEKREGKRRREAQRKSTCQQRH